MGIVHVSKTAGKSTPRFKAQNPQVAIGLWVLSSALPFTPFLRELLRNSLADTPYAYLVWVPVFSFLWAVWGLRTTKRYADDPEVNVLVSVPPLVLCAVLLIHGFSQQWRYIFLGHQIGLLLWPLWSLFMAWLWFGVGITGFVWKPLAYLVVAWPPLYSQLVNYTNPILQTIANTGVHYFSGMLNWITIDSTPGTYLIRYHSTLTPVYVSTVCSGSDSFIAMVVLIPIVLVTLRGEWTAKIYVILLGIGLSLLGNLVRLVFIVTALHFSGPVFALDILHPILGIIIFILLWWILMRLGKIAGLVSWFPKGTFELRTPGYARGLLAGVPVLALTGTLWYLQPQQGSIVHPVTVNTSNLPSLFPNLKGWSRRLLGNYNESSILGTGASTAAASYGTGQGDYVLTELWWSYRPVALQGYGVRDCLLFHGYKILGSSTMQLTKDISATSYVAVVPNSSSTSKSQVFVDTVYDIAVDYHGRHALVRVEEATPVAKISDNADTTIFKQFAQKLPVLMTAPYRESNNIHGLSTNEIIHAYNYYIFIRQFAGTLLGPQSILHYPPL